MVGSVLWPWGRGGTFSLGGGSQVSGGQVARWPGGEVARWPGGQVVRWLVNLVIRWSGVGGVWEPALGWVTRGDGGIPGLLYYCFSPTMDSPGIHNYYTAGSTGSTGSTGNTGNIQGA